MVRRYLSIIACLIALICISSSAFGWLADYDNRRPIQINTTEDITDYQVFINVTNTTDMLTDRADINFTYNDDTPLFFWIEDNSESDYFTVWVNYTGTTANETIYMYYKNNTVVTTQSNLTKTYWWSDTAEIGVITDIWTQITAGAGGISAYTTDYPKQGTKSMNVNVTGGAGSGYWVYTDVSGTVGSTNINATFSYNFYDNGAVSHSNGIELNNQIRSAGSGTGRIIWLGMWDASGYPNHYVYSHGGWVNTTIPRTTGFHKTEIVVFNSNWTIYIDDIYIGTFTDVNEPKYIYFGGGGGGVSNSYGYYDNIRIRKNMQVEPICSIGLEEGNSSYPPVITITTPTNTTYYTSLIPVNITVSDNSVSFSCNISDNETLLTTLTTNITYTINLTKTGGQHNISVSCNDSDGDTSSDIEYYYVWSGLNISAYYSDTGNLSDNWDLYITNGTDNYSNSSINGTVLLEWDTIPTGNITITANESNATLYYIDATTNVTLNSSVYLDLNLTLTLKTSNTVTITSSLGLSLLEGQTTTILCNSTEGTQTLSINDVYVANPYVLTVGVGFYDLLCQVPETASYSPTNKSEQINVNALFSCTTTNTFAFEHNITTTGNITTLNFTDAVSQNLLKSDLSDINISGVVETWKNTTDGYYIIVNNTGTYDLNIRFGNYYTNNSYSAHARTTPLYNMIGYTQINPYQTYNLLDELTGAYLYPPNSTILVIIGCSQGETYINIAENDTQFLIATGNYINKSSVRVTYTADAYYSRQLYPIFSDALILKFYLADAYTTAIDRIDFIMQDQNYYNSKLQVYKTLDAEYIIITEGYFDVSRQFSTYLQEDIDYYLQTNDDGTITDFGRITIVAPDVKYLGLCNMDLTPDVLLMGEYITSNFYTADNYTALHIYYNDDLAQTINATIVTYYENGSIFQSYFSSGVDTINIEYNISDFNDTSFYVTFEVWHELYGNSPLKWSQNVFYPLMFDLGISSFWYGIIGLALLMAVALMVSSGSVIPGSLMFVIVMFVLMGLRWINIGLGVVGLIVFLLLLGAIKEIKQGGS